MKKEKIVIEDSDDENLAMKKQKQKLRKPLWEETKLKKLEILKKARAKRDENVANRKKNKNEDIIKNNVVEDKQIKINKNEKEDDEDDFNKKLYSYFLPTQNKNKQDWDEWDESPKIKTKKNNNINNELLFDIYKKTNKLYYKNKFNEKLNNKSKEEDNKKIVVNNIIPKNEPKQLPKIHVPKGYVDFRVGEF